ncbi:MAG: diaminopimelate decarboxylase [Alphaproteobacteria bacterium]|nr:diaminopimelate decarboxylase [Alphaproteobacteria bacterium]
MKIASDASVQIPENDAFAALSYKNDTLCFEGIAIEKIAEEVGTPFYVYSQLAIEATYGRCAAAFASIKAGIFYAMKANHNQSVLRIFARNGAGVDIVSIGEALRAIAAGIPAERIIFSGAGKTADELAQAVDLGLYQINVESSNELELLNQIAISRGKKAPVAIRINPDVDAKTMSKTTTGKKGNKFGIDIDVALPVYKRAYSLPGINLVGVAVHIGSQLTSVEPFRLAYAKTVDFLKMLRSQGMSIPRLDLGGGLGIWYRDEQVEDFSAWADVVAEATQGLGVEISIAPGRALIAHAGILVSSVVHVKQGSDRRFLVLDAGMNDLARPSLYGAYHHIIPVDKPASGAPYAPVDIVGPVCESTDAFALARPMPELKDGDLVAFLSAGAYGASMSSAYNSRPLVPEVLIDNDRYAVVRPRPTVQSMIDAEPQAYWLDEDADASRLAEAV